MQQRQANKKHKKSQVKIEFTPKFTTSWGGTTFFIKEVLHTNDNKGKKLRTLRMEFLVLIFPTRKCLKNRVSFSLICNVSHYDAL